MRPCVFCQVVHGAAHAHLVASGDVAVAFLDSAPVFRGHVLVVPRQHVTTIADLPSEFVGSYFTEVQRIAAALPQILGCEGTFVAINNVVSQSVPHLHTHVVPRRRKDGLRGFFWPRTKYDSDGDAAGVAAVLRDGLAADDVPTS
jgi:histidine triad (HIT) family protein